MTTSRIVPFVEFVYTAEAVWRCLLRPEMKATRNHRLRRRRGPGQNAHFVRARQFFNSASASEREWFAIF